MFKGFLIIQADFSNVPLTVSSSDSFESFSTFLKMEREHDKLLNSKQLDLGLHDDAEI